MEKPINDPQNTVKVEDFQNSSSIDHRIDNIEKNKNILDPTQSVYIDAIAGSGKTTRLVSRILVLLLNGNKISEILCITFTNAATEEVTKKLEKILYSFVNMDDNNIATAIWKFGIQIKNLDIKKVRRLYQEFVEDIENIKIQTIHGFCNSLLKQYHKSDYIILNNEDKLYLWIKAFKKIAIHLINPQSQGTEINEINNQKIDEVSYIAESFSTLMLFFEADTVLKWTFEIAENIDDSAKISSYKEIIEFVREKNATLIKDKIAAKYNSGFNEEIINDYIKEHDSSILLKFKDVIEGTASRKKAVSDMIKWLLCSPKEKSLYFNEYKNFFLTKKNEARKILFKESILKKEKELGLAFLQEQNNLLEMIKTIENRRYLDISNALGFLAFAIRKEYESMKKACSFMEYKDLLSQTISLLQEEGGSHILYTIYEEVKHILIDEAQDISGEQWDLLKILMEEFYVDITTLNSRSVFIVGDIKQSIFGFQGAKPYLFRDIKSWLKDKIVSVGGKIAYVQLDVCFRCCKEILKVADFISHTITINGENAKHIPANDKDGIVEFWNISRNTKIHNSSHEEATIPNQNGMYENNDNFAEQEENDDETSRDNEHQLIASRIASEIAGWLQLQRKIADTDDFLKASDVMILFRKRSPLKKLLIEELNKYAITFFDFTEHNTYAHIAMHDFICMAKFVLQPYDDLNLAILLRSPIIRNGVDMTCNEYDRLLHDLIYNRKNSILDTIQNLSHDQAVFESIGQKLKHLLHIYEHNDVPLTFFSSILNNDNNLNINACITQEFGLQTQPLVDFFIESVIQFTQEIEQTDIKRDYNIHKDLYSFIKWFERKASSSESSSQKNSTLYNNGIKLMTIHSAKGLEAPVVILADGQYSEKNERTKVIVHNGWFTLDTKVKPAIINSCKDNFQKELKSESMRLLYVAVTRAINELYIVGIDDTDATVDNDNEGESTGENESNTNKKNWFTFLKQYKNWEKVK